MVIHHVLTFIALACSTPLLAQSAFLGFDGNPHDGFTVTGDWWIEREAELVRSGSGSLRVQMGPPHKWPQVRITDPGLAQSVYGRLSVDVFNNSARPLDLWVRVDDATSKGREAEIVRRKFPLPPGWETVSIDLQDLRTTSGGRLLDAGQLTQVIYYLNRPSATEDLIFDDLRLTDPLGTTDPNQLLRAFEKEYAAGATFERRRDLVRG